MVGSRTSSSQEWQVRTPVSDPQSVDTVMKVQTKFSKFLSNGSFRGHLGRLWKGGTECSLWGRLGGQGLGGDCGGRKSLGRDLRLKRQIRPLRNGEKFMRWKPKHLYD